MMEKQYYHEKEAGGIAIKTHMKKTMNHICFADFVSLTTIT